MDRVPLTEDEMVEILEEIARNGRNGAARIAAIKALREIQGDRRPVGDAFAELDPPKLRAVG